MKTKGLILAFALLLLLPLGLADTAILGDTANLQDTRIDQNNPANNFGGNNEFRLESGPATDGQIFTLLWNISEANIPAGASNIRANLVVTSKGSTTSSIRIYEATNTSWDENTLTWNNFFCTTNSTGQVVADASCSIITDEASLSGTNDVVNSLNITNWLTPSDTLKTVVVAARGNLEGEWKGRNSRDGDPLKRPLLIITWDVPPFNTTIQVSTTVDSAIVTTNTTQQTNSTIAYGLVLGSPTNFVNDFGFKFDRTQLITGLTAATSYFANQTVCNVNNTCQDFEYVFTTPSIPAATATLADTIDLSSCLDRTQDLVLFPEFDVAYVYGEDANSPFTTDKIAVVDISNPNSMSLLQCFSTGTNTGFGSGNLVLMPAVTLTDSWLFAGGNLGTRQIRVTGNGTILQNNGTVSVPMGDGAPRTPTNDFAWWMCSDAPDGIYEALPYDETDSLEFNTGFAGTCEGFMPPINGFKGAYYLNDGISFFDSSNLIASYQGGIHTLGSGTGRDVFSINGNNIIASNGNANRYIYNPSTNNATYSSTTTPNGVNCFLKGNAFIASDQVMYLQICTSGGRKPELRVAGIGQTTTESIFNFTQNSQTYGTVEYAFPYAYAVMNNAGNSDLVSVEVISQESQPGINKKPVITITAPATNPVQTGTSIFTGYDVNNPETATLNEQILTTNSCSYTETENFIQDFSNFNFSTCGQAIIGTRKGVEFGNALDLTQCSSDVISAGGTYTDNMIVSFDIYASVDSTADIELVQTDGTVLTTLQFDITNDKLQMIAGTQTILSNISTTFGGQDIPTRIFIQMTPGSTNSNLVNKIYYSTNYFALNDDIDTTYCDETEFCYIGNFATTTLSLNDFRAITINGATGDMALDNFRVVTTPEYPEYTATSTINNLNAACTYDLTGTNTNRVYASDTVYGHNYLASKDVVYEVTQEGTITIPPQPVNGSVSSAINSIVGIGGFIDEPSLLLLALIFMLSTAIGAFKFGLDGMGIAVIEAIEVTLFFFLGWVPLSVFVILGLFTAGLVAIVARQTFIGGGS